MLFNIESCSVELLKLIKSKLQHSSNKITKKEIYLILDNHYDNQIEYTSGSHLSFNSIYQKSLLRIRKRRKISEVYLQSRGLNSRDKATKLKTLKYLPPIPEGVTYLNCNDNRLKKLVLPTSLQTLNCEGNLITNLQWLPRNLLILNCSNNKLTSLPDLQSITPNLQKLFCGENKLTILPNLPITLTILNLYQNLVADLGDLSYLINLRELYCSRNKLSDSNLQLLPNSLQILYCWNNNLTSLPILPNTLQQLDCEGNELTSLPELPTTLELLKCGCNEITSLPDLPNSLRTLFCSKNKLTSLPTLPNTLRFLDYKNNPIVIPPILPPNLW